MQVLKNRQAGLNEAESRRETLLQFGRPGTAKEECRDQRRIGLIEMLRQDIRYAVRGFWHTPAFALTVIATIGLGFRR
jgi:hypothetical protein